MSKGPVTADDVLTAIQSVAADLGRAPSKADFTSRSGITEYWVFQHFDNWNAAVSAAGHRPNTVNKKVDPPELLADWARVVRSLRRIPTRTQYRKTGGFSPGTFEKPFQRWGALPRHFRDFARDKPEWADVLALLPEDGPPRPAPALLPVDGVPAPGHDPSKHAKLRGRPTYGNPIDFRGLRHEPVNEQGVVFLFGMVARELGYHVEAVQTGFPDCEAKRQVSDGSWQRVRIEFEYESRNFRDHGHAVDGCDVIVCWAHNWLACPPELEVLELRSVIRTLASADE